MNTVHFLNGKTAFSISETLRRWGREEKQQAKNHKTKAPQRPNLPRLFRYIKGTQKCSTWNILKNATQSQACRKVFSRYPLPRPAKLKLQTFPYQTQKGESPHARQTIPLPQPRPAHRCGTSCSRQPPAPTRGIPRRPALRCIRYLWPLSRSGQIWSPPTLRAKPKSAGRPPTSSCPPPPGAAGNGQLSLYLSHHHGPAAALRPGGGVLPAG